MAIFGPPQGVGGGLPLPPPPLYQRQIFVKKGPKEDSKTRAWLNFRAFLRVSDPKNGVFGPRPQNPPKWPFLAKNGHFGPQEGKTPKNGHFWGFLGVTGSRPWDPWDWGQDPNPTLRIFKAKA